MNKKIIRLTEEELHGMVKQVINQSLNEIDGKNHTVYLMPQQWQ
jgi:hypothetical protein